MESYVSVLLYKFNKLCIKFGVHSTNLNVLTYLLDEH